MITRWHSVLPALGLSLAVAGAVPAQTDTAAGAPSAPAAAAAMDPGWPRTFTKNGSTVIMHQPQVDAWKDQSTLRFRCALEVTPAGADQPDYGVAAVQADTHVDSSTATVILTNITVAVRFPGLPAAEALPLEGLVEDLLPTLTHLTISLDRVLAYMHDQVKPKTVNVSLAPPPIFYSSSPAILVVFIGTPQFKPVTGTQVMFAVNTNWPVLLDRSTLQYYLLDGNSWFTTGDAVNGPWTPAQQLPTAELANLPAAWENVSKHVPGQPFGVVPTVFVSTQPAELMVTDGPPDYSPIPDTTLMYVSNPVMPLFMELATNTFYHLVAGRWFSAPTLSGPWSAASANLPGEFARIPASSPVGFVLSSIPGTQEARDAVLLAHVVHKATVNTATAKLNVTYEGPPSFAAIEGTSLQYAINTPYEVINAAGTYYCCYQAVWFAAPAAEGPWTVCTSVPQIIYTIPPSCPDYNVTYVTVYDATPGDIVMGYTGGYTGEYVASTGALMYGAGMLPGVVIADGGYWSCCSPTYYSYGCHAYYNCSTGCYGCGNADYGPHGGCGWGAAYNPATGSWTRGAYAYGPCGSYGIHTGYDANTNTWAGHAGGTNGYQSWGSTAVSQGDRWATASHVTGPSGVTHGWAETSSGASAQYVHGNNGTVAATSNGDIYAGNDGNVYRHTSDGQWQSYNPGSGWQGANRAQPASTPAVASSFQNDWQNNFSSNQWQNSWRNQGAAAAVPAAAATPSYGQQFNNSQAGLNQDAFSRGWGNSNAMTRSGFGGGGGFGGGAGGGFGGGDRFGGGFRR